VPETSGGAVFAGAAGRTAAVEAEVCEVEPPAFWAVTTTRRYLPISAEVRL